MTHKKLALLLLLLTAPALPAMADSIPYSHSGTLAPEVTTYATGNSITAYYLGSTAGNEDQIQIFDVNTGYRSGKFLDNKQTQPGAQVTVGTGAGEINAGDQIVFFIDSPDGTFGSLASYSPDNINHAYITMFSGGNWNNTAIPAGLFVGMEDLPYGRSDLNYNDLDLAVTGVSQSRPVAATPEPASLALLATGLLGAACLYKRRSA